MPPKKYAKGGAGRRVPKADELTEVARPVRAQNGPAPIILCVHKYSDKATDLWPAIDDPGAALYQLQVAHAGKPSITYDIFGSVNKFLREASVENPELPTSVADLARAGIRIVLTNADDPEGAGCFVPYRIALYVAGKEEALHNALILLDDFFLWKQRQMARERPFDVHMHARVPLDPVGLENCKYSFHTAMESLPLGIFQAHPVHGKRIASVHLEPLGTDAVSLVFAGRVWPFRERLDEYGVRGAYSNSTGDGHAKKYFRALRVNATDGSERRRALDIFANVFNGLAMRLHVVCEPQASSPAAAFLNDLRSLTCLHA